MSLLNKALRIAPIGCFEKGERYKLCKDSLIMKKNNKNDLIVKLGCSTGEKLFYLLLTNPNYFYKSISNDYLWTGVKKKYYVNIIQS